MSSNRQPAPRKERQALHTLAFVSPVSDDLFVENNDTRKNEPQRGDLFVNEKRINNLHLNYYN